MVRAAPLALSRAVSCVLDNDTIVGLAGIASRGLSVARGNEVTVVDTRRSLVQARQ